MASLRLFSLTSIALASSLIACGGDGATPPSGPHYTYVVDDVTVPANNNQARDIALDLDGDKLTDNQLGMVLGVLSMQGFDLKGTLTKAVQEGSIILLLDLQTPSFASTSGAGLEVKLGDNPMPVPCVNPQMPTPETCGKHLSGTGSFTVAAGSPEGAGVDGKIAGSVFNGGPGDIPLQIALSDMAPIQLDLIGARAKATGMSESGIESVILAGGLLQTDLDSKVLPAIHAQLGPIITDDCIDPNATLCMCPEGSTGRTIISLFDANDDCTVTIDEIKTNSLIQSLLKPDVDLRPDIPGDDCLSLGIQVTAVPATVR